MKIDLKRESGDWVRKTGRATALFITAKLSRRMQRVRWQKKKKKGKKVKSTIDLIIVNERARYAPACIRCEACYRSLEF